MEQADSAACCPSNHPTAPLNPTTPSSLMLRLPHECLLNIMAFLDVPDLLAVSRTCTHLRPLPIDPLLHRQRLQSVPPRLSISLSRRPPLTTLTPPRSLIYLTPTALTGRHVHRALISARLRRRLTRRPDITDLVSRNVLPGECFAFVFATAERPGSRSRVAGQARTKGTRTSVGAPGAVVGGRTRCKLPTKDEATCLRENKPPHSRPSSSSSSLELRGPGYISPSLVHAKRLIERERVKDRIRSWVEGRGRQELERRQREEDSEHSVARLIRRFRTRGKEGEGAASVSMEKKELVDRGKERWGRGAVKWAETRKRDPTRAHVLGLRRFWESVGRAERSGL